MRNVDSQCDVLRSSSSSSSTSNQPEETQMQRKFRSALLENAQDASVSENESRTATMLPCGNDLTPSPDDEVRRKRSRTRRRYAFPRRRTPPANSASPNATSAGYVLNSSCTANSTMALRVTRCLYESRSRRRTRAVAMVCEIAVRSWVANFSSSKMPWV